MFNLNRTQLSIPVVIVSLLLVYGSTSAQSRKKSGQKPEQGIYVDKAGIMRWNADNKEAAFFGVNYTVPFAYGYRSHKALGVDLEKAIDDDVYHFARLGVNAFRVHMWDVELSDSAGNLIENEHLRLFDYLLYQLKKRNIRTMLTPIAFWGNGYPERDQKTPGFATVYGKGPSVVKEAAIKAQENYITQLLHHVNPYTKSTYQQDDFIVALEINNEPHHSGPRERTTEYVNRLTAAAKAAGWTKPVFYNISESPSYAGAVVAANVEGHSFQWYPTGLVANRTLQGNYLPNVDRYTIPFGDSIPRFRQRAKMVYEFDAGDVLQPIMYPAMARSFRTAGFQWATQFAYDPLNTAYANTEYQTHYLNLVYTPSKAISLLIASKAFQNLERSKSYGTYPSDTVFGDFRVSYRDSLSEMNSASEFYYSNSTSTRPRSVATLKHIAGTGNSPVVKYNGYGTYFLDKVKEGVWRLEVYPDAFNVNDPFGKASPRKAVTVVEWNTNSMQLGLPDLGSAFTIKGLNPGNGYQVNASNGSFQIAPGTYMLYRAGSAADTGNASLPDLPAIGMREFVAPAKARVAPMVIHQPLQTISSAKDFVITAQVIGADTSTRLVAEIRNISGRWTNLTMQRSGNYDFHVTVPAAAAVPGVLKYRIILYSDSGTAAFPGHLKGDPYAWDAYQNETWQTMVAADYASLILFSAAEDADNLNVFNNDRRNNSIGTITMHDPSRLLLAATVGGTAPGQMVGWHSFVGDRLRGRETELSSFDTLVIRALATGALEVGLKIGLIDKNAVNFSTLVRLGESLRDIKVPLNVLRKDSTLLLPRPYPGFLPPWFNSAASGKLNVSELDKLEMLFQSGGKPTTVIVESVSLIKRKK